MKNLDNILGELGIEKNITLDDIPNIDLYMDQVIQLFEGKFDSSKRNEDEKVLTKTMINNYAKGKLFFPIKSKKYSKEHLILLALIYQLKGSLSIGDVKATLTIINDKLLNNELDLAQFYNSYLSLSSSNAEHFTEEIQIRARGVKEQVAKMSSDSEELEQVMMIASMVNLSNMYRRAAEKMIDQLPQKEK